MIDTFMVLWNRGSRHRGARVCFTFSLVCISLCLFLVTIIIPGWVLLVQNDESMAAARADEALLATAQSIDDRSTPIIPTPLVVNAASVTSVACVVPTPALATSAPDTRIGRSVRGRSQVLPAAPTPAILAQNANAKVLVVPHIVYSGRPRGAVSHLQSSALEMSTPTAVATRSIFSSATASSAYSASKATPSLQVPMQKATQLHAHALFVAVQGDDVPMSKTALAPVAPSSQARVVHRLPARSTC